MPVVQELLVVGNLETLREAEVEVKRSLLLQNPMKKETEVYQQLQSTETKTGRDFKSSPSAVKQKARLSPSPQLQNDTAAREPANHLTALCGKLSWSRKTERKVFWGTLYCYQTVRQKQRFVSLF